jgi:fermentation-respiration switch protein FrsA (DUF1100 family)
MLAIILSAVLASSPSPSTSTAEAAEDAPLKCETGPSSRTYAGHDWIVWGCADGQSVVLAAGKGNPAQPFFFILSPADEGVRLYGEGTGDKSVTEPAYLELQKLTARDLELLVQETHTK